MINLMGTGSNLQELEVREHCLMDQVARCVPKTLLSVFAGLLGTWPDPLWKHILQERKALLGGQAGCPSGNWEKHQEHDRKQAQGEGKGRPLWQALQSNVHLWGNSVLSLCSSILMRENLERWMPYLPGHDCFTLTWYPCSWNNCCAMPGSCPAPSGLCPKQSNAEQSSLLAWWTLFSWCVDLQVEQRLTFLFSFFQVRAALWDIRGEDLLLRQNSTNDLHFLLPV